MSGGAAASKAEVENTLQLLGQQLTDSGHPLQAIKCYVALLSQSLMPTDEAATLLKLGQLLMEHTHNVQEAKQHLQKVEMLVLPLPGQHLLKCEVLAALAAAHQVLGEVEFQRRCFTKGLEQCKDVAASQADKRILAEWSIYFHMHLAESLAAKGQTTEATLQVELAAAIAASQGLTQQQVLCNLFQLQLAILHFERADVSAISASVQELLHQCEEQQQDSAADSHVAQLKLHFLMLQVMMVVQSGSFKELNDSKEPKEGAAAAAQASAIIDQMDELLHQVAGAQLQTAQQRTDKGTSRGAQQQQQQCEWLPAPVMAAAVHLLAAEVDKNAGKQKQGQARIANGLRVLDAHIAALMQDKVSASDAPAKSRPQQELRSCLCLRVLLLETRMQMHLLCSNFAAASADAASSISVLSQYPKLLAGLGPVVHMQAGLYAQAVTLYAAAVRHFMAAAAEAQEWGMLHLATDARQMAAICYMAQQDEASVKAARELIGEVSIESDADLGYGSRVLQHTVAGLLGLCRAGVTSDDRANAKQHFSRALKMAHKHLHNHQVVSQLLLVMAPLQLAAADASGARSMVSSCVQLSHGAGDLHTQVSALSLMQVLLAAGTDEEETAKNRNYVARKQQELSGRIQEAESEAQQHHLVLTWGLA